MGRRALRPVAIVMLALLPVIVVGATVVVLYTSSARDGIVAQRLARARSVADAADGLVSSSITTLNALALTPLMKNADTIEVNAFVTSVVAQNPDWFTIGLSDANGLNISSTAAPPRSVSIADRDYFQGALAGHPTVGSVVIARGNQPVRLIVIGVPITFSDGSKGVLSGGLRLNRVERQLAALTGSDTMLRVIDQRGQEFVGPTVRPDAIQDVSQDPDVALATSEPSGARTIAIGGVDTLVAHAAVPTSGWTVIVAQPVSAAFAVPDRELQVTLGLAATGLVGAMIVAYVVGRRIARSDAQIEAERRRVVQLASAIAAERDELQQLIDGVPEGIVLRRMDGTVVVNQAAQRLVGTIASDPTEIGATLGMRHLDGTPYERDEVPVVRALRGEEVHGEQVLVRPVGAAADRTLLVSSAPVLRDDSVIAAATIFQDISDIKALEAQRAEFFSVASHEIKTPVTAMHLQLQILQRLVATGATQRFAEMVDRALGRSRALAELVTDLLEASRIESGRLTLEMEDADLGALVREVAETFPSDDQHPLRVVTPATPVPVRADPRRVREIVENVVTNAMKYSPDGGEIVVQVALEPDVARVRISDRGFGIPASEQPYVFDRFFRTSRARPYGGVGLGLYISRDIARRHGGDLVLESSSEDGSTFTLTLPLAVPSAPTATDDGVAAGT